jgi:hypothetical protein
LNAEDLVFTAAALTSFEAHVRQSRPRRSAHEHNRSEDPRDVVIKPIISEKSYALIDEGKYTFEVDPRSNKTEIKQADGDRSSTSRLTRSTP